MNILIVGGSSGIGLALAKNLVQAEHQVIVVSRRFSDSLKNLAIKHIALDVSENFEGLTEQLPEQLHSVVYCPGSINLKPFHRLTEAEFLADFQVNVLGAIRVLQASFKALKQSQGASVLMFSTVAATLGMNFHSSIAIAKSGIEGLTKSLAAEWAIHHIRVNAIAPSLTDTPLAEKILNSPEKRDASAKRHPLGRVGTAEDLANLAEFLISDKADWVTGQIIGVDGGMGSLKP
jgi:3-oxoacyl-[acyl-carrier protein] reductase